MESAKINGERFRTAFVLVLVLAISALFVAVMWPFLQALLIGAILAGLCHPLYRWMVRLLRGRESLASAVTLLILFSRRRTAQRSFGLGSQTGAPCQ